MKSFVNGKFVGSSKAVVSIMDHGFLYGDGIYETIRIRDRQAFLLSDHLKRLRQSARGISLRVPWSNDYFKKVIHRLVKINKHKEGVVRITLTRGVGDYGFDPRLCGKPTLVVTSRPFKPYPQKFFSFGITLGLVSIKRNSPLSLPPEVKSTSCLNGVLAKIEANKLGAHEALMTTLDGALAEGSVSSLFLVQGNKVLTPARKGDILPGVTQKRVLKIAKKAGLGAFERELTLKDLKRAEEVFLTNTTMNIMPVSKIVRRGRFASKKQSFFYSVGPVTRNLMSRFLVR